MHGMVLRPVGSRPAATYWRRRIVLLAVIAIVVVVAVRACGGGSGSAGRQHRQARGAHTTRAAGPCVSNDLSAAVTLQPAHGNVGSPVRFTGVVSNTSAVACLLQITPSEVVWSVRSAATKVWNCATSYTTQRSLPPSGSLRLRISWQGKVSKPPKCSGTTPAPAGSYAVRLRLAGISSSPAGFTLTGARSNSQG